MIGGACQFDWHEKVLPERISKIDELLSKCNSNYESFAQEDYEKEWKNGHLPNEVEKLKIGGYNVKEMASTTKLNNGGTFKAYSYNDRSKFASTYYRHYDMSHPTQGYCVALHSELGTWISADATEEEIECYIETYLTRNADLLQGDSQLYFGTWVSDDPETFGMISLDITAIISDRDLAMSLGGQYNQQAIFDLTTFETIPCGGTGTSVSGELLLEADVARNYVLFSHEYLCRKFDDDDMTMEQMLAEQYVYHRIPPCCFGFESYDIKDAEEKLRKGNNECVEQDHLINKYPRRGLSVYRDDVLLWTNGHHVELDIEEE